MVDRSRSSCLGHCESLRDEVSRSTAEAGKKFHSQAEAESAEEQILGGIAETPAMVLFLITPRACRYRKFRLASTSFRNGSKGAALHERRERLVVTMFTFWAENIA